MATLHLVASEDGETLYAKRHHHLSHETLAGSLQLPARSRSRKPCIGDLRGNAVSSPSGRGHASPDGTRKQPV